MTIRDQEIEFPHQGLVFVSGQNSWGFESIGAGKTSLGEALAIAVTGVRGRFSSLGHYSTKEKGNTLVVVEGTLAEKSVVIEMGHKCKELSKSGEGLRFTIDGRTIARSNVDLTRQELCQTLRITQSLAPWTTYVDGDKLDFKALSQSQSVELLMAALSQPSWTTYHIKAKKTLDQLEEDIATKSASKDTLTELIQSTTASIEKAQKNVEEKQLEFNLAKEKMVEQLSGAKQLLSVTQSKVSDIESQRKTIKENIKRIENELALQFKELETEEMALRGEKSTISLKKKPLLEKERELVLTGSQAEKELRTLKEKPKECPTCKKPWDKGPSANEIEKATAKLADVQAELGTIRKKIEEVQVQEDAKQKELDAIQTRQKALNVRDRVRDFSNELDRLDESERNATRTITSLVAQITTLEKGPSDREVVKAVSILDEKKKNLEEYRTKLDLVTDEVKETQELCKVVSYWTTAFCPTGIPNLVLSKSVSPLNQISMALSHRLSGGTLTISYETVKELASGEQRNSLNIMVKNSLGASRVAGNSKGESGLNNFIIAETINEVGQVSSRVGFRWYDEVVSNQDNKVRKAIVHYLKETAHRLGILIFVVDHHPEVAALADYVLRATKDKEGVTTFKWI